MTRIEEIKNRRLSISDQNALKYLAARSGEEVAEEIETNTHKPEIEKVEVQVETAEPQSIESLVNYYHSKFNGNSNLVLSAMQLEGAALIAKAIREYKWSENRK